ncbi:hypothetical protein MMC29_002131 [Sticta canariensis]|nr:hypothetical protein [Sticta canariensis]
MNFLAFLIAGFSISIAALLSDNSDPTDPASLSLDLPLSDSLSLDIPDERDIASLPLESSFPSSLSLNPPASLPLDPSLSGSSPLDPTVSDKELSPSIDNPDVVSFQAADVPESITFNPNIDPNPSANSADQPSITDLSPGHTEAKTSTDDSNQICDARSDTSQKLKKRDETFCMTLESYLFLPNPKDHDHEEGESDEEIRRKDKAWERRYFLEDIDERNTLQLSIWLSSRGREACKTREGGIYKHALCCLGPEQFEPAIRYGHILPPGVTIDILPPLAPLMNVYRCIGFLDLRPFCVYGVKYCCKFIRNPYLSESWRMGFHGLNCIRMPPLA